MLRRDLTDALVTSGSINSPNDVTRFSDQEHRLPLLAALQFASTSHLARVKLPEARFEDSMSGAIRKQHESREVKFFDDSERVFIHPSSTLFSVNKIKSGFITFFDKVITSKPFLRMVAEGMSGSQQHLASGLKFRYSTSGGRTSFRCGHQSAATWPQSFP